VDCFAGQFALSNLPLPRNNGLVSMVRGKEKSRAFILFRPSVHSSVEPELHDRQVLEQAHLRQNSFAALFEKDRRKTSLPRFTSAGFDRILGYYEYYSDTEEVEIGYDGSGTV
jgi:hypothetical protein